MKVKERLREKEKEKEGVKEKERDVERSASLNRSHDFASKHGGNNSPGSGSPCDGEGTNQ